jgi:hypothetical protein
MNVSMIESSNESSCGALSTVEIVLVQFECTNETVAVFDQHSTNNDFTTTLAGGMQRYLVPHMCLAPTTIHVHSCVFRLSFFKSRVYF